VDTLPGALVERERELEVVERLLDAARSGAGGVALVEGPPGIGKSSVLSAARAAAADLRVVSARGGELERELPFGIARQLLEPVLASAADDERGALLDGAAELAEPVLLAPAREDPAEPPFSALHGLHWLTVNLAAGQPVLMLVDDLQWADLASLRWLVYLARRVEGVPLALLLATRPTEPGPAQELQDELVALPDVGLITPSDLSERATAGLAAAVLGDDPDPEFVSACRSATGGNPFLLRELLGELSRRGVAPTRDNAGAAGQLSSQGVGRAVRARMRPLPGDCMALARAVAVLGDSADLSLSAQLAGLDEDAASRAADLLADVSVLEPRRPLGFVHALVRSSIEAGLSAGERADLHERAARVLEAAGAEPDRVALHLLMTSPRGERRTAETLRLAGAGASARGAPDAAVAYLSRALAEPSPDELAPLIEHELGAAALRAGDLDTAIVHLRAAASQIENVERRAEAAEDLGSALFLGFNPAETVSALSEVIESLPDGAREQGLRLQAVRWTAARASLSAWRELRARGDRFVVAEQRDATTSGERLSLAVAALHAVRERTAAEARDLALRALGDGQRLDDPSPESAGFWIAPLVLLWSDALEEATTVAAGVMDWANRRGSLPAFAMAAHLRAYAWWRRGSLSEAEVDATSALEQESVLGFPPYAQGALARVLVARSELAAAEAVFEQADEFLGHAPDSQGGRRIAFSHLQARAGLRLAQRRPAEALDDLMECGRREREWEVGTPAFSTWRAEAAPLLAALGRTDEAIPLAQEEVERCRAFGAPVPLGLALRAQGLVESREELLEESVALLAESPARLEQALSLLELGAAMRRSGRRAEAREPLGQALELARSCGADAVAARAHEELVAAGARPRRDPTESRTHLTAGELRVARMAADGMTNREIAQALFLTENTIQTHLRSVFRKLDISSRSQLPRAL
jgi:DNA-binding CsgD family transcriptional regulator